MNTQIDDRWGGVGRIPFEVPNPVFLVGGIAQAKFRRAILAASAGTAAVTIMASPILRAFWEEASAKTSSLA